MSGGVDSSVAAYLLKKAGHDVIGVSMKTWETPSCGDERSKSCCSLRDIDDARAVAGRLEIPFYVLDLCAEFEKTVIDPFVEEYLRGRTPNPCIECNTHVKFGVLMKKASEVGASYVATGHYVRCIRDPAEGRFCVAEGVDKVKDQSYVLFGLSSEQLSKTLFPLGELAKAEVRKLANEIGLRVHSKPDSQEICFVRDSYADFVRSRTGEGTPGEGVFIGPGGEILGKHGGTHLFTIGQKKRVHLRGIDNYYVTKIDSEKNAVHVGPEKDLYCEGLVACRANWQLSPRTGEIFVKIRSKHQKALASIEKIEGERVFVRFAEPQKSVTPGQAAVFYLGDRVLGGGWIDEKWQRK